jgi:hypothetical protein
MHRHVRRRRQSRRFHRDIGDIALLRPVESHRLHSSWFTKPDRYAALLCVCVLLAADQQEYAERFAECSGLKGSDRYQGGPWRPLPSGVLCLANSIAAFDCEVEDTIERRTHAIVIGRVRHVFMGAGSGALVYWRGGYDQVGWSGDQIARATGLAPGKSRLRKRAP